MHGRESYQASANEIGRYTPGAATPYYDIVRLIANTNASQDIWVSKTSGHLFQRFVVRSLLDAKNVIAFLVPRCWSLQTFFLAELSQFQDVRPELQRLSWLCSMLNVVTCVCPVPTGVLITYASVGKVVFLDKKCIKKKRKYSFSDTYYWL